MILPDCAACGGRVEVAIDVDGAFERCIRCGLEQRPVDNLDDVRARVLAYRTAAGDGGQP